MTDQTQAPTSDEQAVRERDAARWAAARANDVAAFRAIAHPDFTYTHSTGYTDTLEDYAGKLGGGSYTFHSLDTPITEVVVAGDTAVVRARMVAELTSGGVERSLNSVTIAAWSRIDGEWRLLAFQSTPAPKG